MEKYEKKAFLCPRAFENISYPGQICINRDQSSWKASFGIDSIKNCDAVEKYQRKRQLDSPVWHKGSIIHQLSGRSVIFWRFQRDTHQKYTTNTYTREEILKMPTLINCVRIPDSSFPPGWFHGMRLIRENAALVFLTTGLGFPIKWVPLVFPV